MAEWKTPTFVEIHMNAEIGAYGDLLASADTLPDEPDPEPDPAPAPPAHDAGATPAPAAP